MKQLAVLIGLFALLLVASPVMAFSPPAQGTDNATDVVNWYGENQTITIASANVTIQDLETAMVAASEAHANIIVSEISDIVDRAFTFILLLGIVALAYWHREKWLYLIAGLGFLVYGFSYFITAFDITPSIRILAILVGVYCFVKMAAKGGKHEES